VRIAISAYDRGSSAERLVTTRWGYVSYLELVRVRMAGLSFPKNLGRSRSRFSTTLWIVPPGGGRPT